MWAYILIFILPRVSFTCDYSSRPAFWTGSEIAENLAQLALQSNFFEKMEDDLNGGWLECLQNKLSSMHTFIIFVLHLIIDYTCAWPSIYSTFMVIRYNFQSGYFN